MKINLETIGKVKNIVSILKKVFARIVAGKCVACGECKEEWKSGSVCANRDCEKCGMNNGR